MAELNPNAITGLGSKLNTREIVDRFMAIEQRRIKPVEARKEQKVSELEAWEAVKSELNKLQGVTEALDKFEIWEARKVETSDPDVIVPKARKDMNSETEKHEKIHSQHTRPLVSLSNSAGANAAACGGHRGTELP